MKIALIAMSGIRCCDEELLRLGLTLPGFVERSKTIASLPSLGLLTLAALTPERHQVEYIEAPNLDGMDNLPTDFDLVAISTFTAQVDEAYALADRFRFHAVPVAMGGPHVTARPDEALRHCDAIALGEGELVWPKMLNDLEDGWMRQVYDARKQNYDLRDAPLPFFELLDISKYNRLTVQTSRGCPHSCEFCASSPLIVDHYKQKPVGLVVREIERIHQIWPEPFVEFADDNAFVNKKYWKKLLRELKQYRFKWFAETDLTVAEDEELLDLMRESGCAQVLIGFESPTETGLPGIERKRDWKWKKYNEYRDAIRAIQSRGITVNGCFIIGLDGHGPEIFEEVHEFVRETELYEVQVTVQTAFPGTALYRRLRSEGRLLEPTNWNRCTLFDVNYVPSHMTPGELRDGFRDLVVKLYGDEFTRWRRQQFRQQRRSFHQKEKASL